MAIPIISPTALSFKGDGFYVNDSKAAKDLQEKNEKLRRK